jgi:hypothetical protein
MGPAAVVIAILVGDFLLTWGGIHGALELIQVVGMPWEPTWFATLIGTVAFKVIKAIL